MSGRLLIDGAVGYGFILIHLFKNTFYLNTFPLFHVQTLLTGVYGFCMDNRDGKFVEKLVFFYLSGYLSQSWDLTQGEIEQYDEKAQNISNAIHTVDTQVCKIISRKEQ